MKPFLQRAAVTLRAWGYRGSGQNYRRLVEGNVFVVNFQKSRDGRGFFVNLGGQPCSIPDEGESDPNPRTLKEYECVFRQRLPGEHSVNISPADADALLATLGAARETLEATILSMRELSTRGRETELFDQRRFMGPAPRAALILARLLAADGHAPFGGVCRVKRERRASTSGRGGAPSRYACSGGRVIAKGRASIVLTDA